MKRGAVVLAAVIAVLIALGATWSCASWSDTEVDAAELDEPVEVVVLIHGLGRTHMSMMPMAWWLEDQGYEVVNWGYSSTCCSAEELGEQLAADLAEIESSDPQRIHFVGHSLGNIIVQSALEHRSPANTGRVVMLAPPNQGSESADRYVDVAGWVLEPLEDLTTDDESTVRRLSPELDDFDVGVIAGQYDGKVSVEESHHDAEDAHEIVPARHTFIMNQPDARDLIASFLKTGMF